VKQCLKFPGMKYVWLPMVDSYHHRRVVYDDWSGAGVHLLDDRGKALPALAEICKICADHDLVLASGHYPYRENAVVVEQAKKAGVRRIEIIHPAHIHSKHTIEQMKILAREGAMLMLSGLGHLVFPLHETGPVYAVRMIKEVGADHLVYGSDFGQLQNFSHVLAAKWFIKVLLAYGATREEIVKIFKTNTARHIGLEARPA
jgi:predicted TIM-barrel fold metal-dependent hydrolase